MPLNTARFPSSVHYLETTPSTMIEAARLAAEGAPHGTVVVAEEQTAGQGRYERRWHSEPESGLYLTLILRPNLSPTDLPLITMTLGLAVAEAITQTTGLKTDIRWPNDILIGDKKVCGILTQLEGTAVLSGIGINVNHRAFPDDLAPIATSLRIAAEGKKQSREDLLLAVLNRADHFLEILTTYRRRAILDLFTEASSYVRGRRVLVEQAGETLQGTTDGLDDAGFLLLRTTDGRRVTILAGGVRPDPSATL